MGTAVSFMFCDVGISHELAFYHVHLRGAVQK